MMSPTTRVVRSLRFSLGGGRCWSGWESVRRAASASHSRSSAVLSAPPTVSAKAAAVEVEERSRIRNFSIIAHVDHGKSTLADRLMQTTRTVSSSELEGQQQLLDDMELEKERGITIKMRSVRMNYTHRSGGDEGTGEAGGHRQYQLNLIDTPGHVDFSYEVSRSLAAVEGALLVVDASQGVQAQTVANVDLAIENDLEIFTVLNKIDLPHAEPDRVLKEVEKVIGLDPDEALLVSAKQGIGIDKVLEAIVERIPCPQVSSDEPLRALVFDSYYDVFRGVVVFVRLKGGRLRKGDRVKVLSTKAEYVVEDVGIFTPGMCSVHDGLRSGEVGYVICGVKALGDVPVGDTITLTGRKGAETSLPGYRTVKPMVFCGLFSSDGEFDSLRDALNKLKLNDASLVYHPENNVVLGMGFRCGFLGLLHLDIVKERLEREYKLRLIASVPSVTYQVEDRAGRVSEVTNPCQVPHDAASIAEPFVRVDILSPAEYSGALMELFRTRQAALEKMDRISDERISLAFDMPLVEVVSNLHDAVKSVSRGYASFDYHVVGMRKRQLARMDFCVGGSPVPALSFIVPREEVHKRGKRFCAKLKELIPRHYFRVAIQAKVGAKVVAAEHIEPLKKDVTAKCYGGDVSRKKKLLTKQKEGKKRMRMFGSVDVPEEAFHAMMRFNR